MLQQRRKVGRAGPVTEQEVLDALTSAQPHALSPHSIGVAVWHQRGGLGDPANRSPVRDLVPVVHDYHVEPILTDLVQRGIAVAAPGEEADRIGTPARGQFRSDTNYYALATAAKQHRRQAEQLRTAAQATARTADQIADVLGNRATAVHPVAPGAITIELTLDQANQLLIQLTTATAQTDQR